jgi:hypothetical protein
MPLKKQVKPGLKVSYLLPLPGFRLFYDQWVGAKQTGQLITKHDKPDST